MDAFGLQPGDPVFLAPDSGVDDDLLDFRPVGNFRWFRPGVRPELGHVAMSGTRRAHWPVHIGPC